MNSLNRVTEEGQFEQDYSGEIVWTGLQCRDSFNRFTVEGKFEQHYSGGIV